MKIKLRTIKVISRAALGLVWFYEGLVPKILFLRADELDLVRRSGVIWRTPEWTLQVLGIAQIVLGIWLIVGWAERVAVAIATIWMLACAITVWVLAPLPTNG
jgi:peptidoglycan/LPS O-acetylase OafA/YrhL